MPGGVTVETGVKLTLRDGVTLNADVYSPDRPGRYPTLLMRLPYGAAVASAPVYRHPAWYAAQGFTVAIQEVRGSGLSEGHFYPLRDELPDTLVAIEWAAALPRSNGRVGMYGFSFQGAVQLQAASCAPAGLRCIAPAQTALDFYDGWHYEGGVPLYGGIVGWALQLGWISALHDQRDADAMLYRRAAADLDATLALPPLLPEAAANLPWARDWLEHESYDAYWANLASPPAPALPALWTSGWYDTMLGGTMAAYRASLEEGGAEQSLVAGPWVHLPWSRSVGVRDFGPEASSPVDALQVAFFRRYLCDEGPAPSSARVFVTGLDAWRAARTLPVAERQVRLHLGSGGDAAGEPGGMLSRVAPGGDGFDTFTSEPLTPVPALGGHGGGGRTPGAGPFDQRPIEARHDVLVYTSPPLDEDLWVTGRPAASLNVATSGEDCDWVVRLCEVEPSGRSINVTQGALRSRYRDSLSTPSPVRPFVDTRVNVQMWDCSHLFRAGNRIRIHVAGSSFPHYGRNPGIAGPVSGLPASAYRPVVQFVLHGRTNPSWVDLPVASLDASEPWSPHSPGGEL